MAGQYLQRAIAATVSRALKTFPSVVLTGPRQSGKTTLLRHEFGMEFRYVSLEDPDLRAASLSDPRGFLAAHPPPCILDEVQNSAHLLSYIKSAIDDDRKPGRWILTGSRHFPLMEGITQSLAGRAAVLQLHGLAAAEIPPQRRLETPRELLVGSFPEPRLAEAIDLRLWWEAISRPTSSATCGS